jgi:Papain family cysteine protease
MNRFDSCSRHADTVSMTEAPIENLRIILEEVPVEGKPLGRNVNWDPRSLQFRVTPQPARTLRTVRHKRVIPILNQGSIGSCTGNAATGAVGTSPLFEGLMPDHPVLDQSLAVNIYSKATAIDGFGGTYPPTDTGSDGLSVAKVCQKLGLISGYLHATSLEGMQTALQNTPVIIGINWYEGFDDTDANGVVKIAGQARGGHEVEVIAVDFENQFFEAVNSWGPGWGINGHFLFSFSDMDRLLHEYGDSTQLLPFSVPAPQPLVRTPEEIRFMDEYKGWRKGVFSKLTKAGRLKSAGDAMVASWGRDL